MSNSTFEIFNEIINLIPPIIRDNTKQARKAIPLSDSEKADIAEVINLGYQDSVRLLKKYVSPSRFKPKEQKDEFLIKAIYLVTYRLYAQYYDTTDAERAEDIKSYNDKKQDKDINGKRIKVSKDVNYRYEKLKDIGIDCDYVIDNTEKPVFVSKGLVRFKNGTPYGIMTIDFQTRVLMDLDMYRIKQNNENGNINSSGSKNTWTKWGISPQKDYERNCYVPIRYLFYYNGIKHNELGYMLNSLVKQSGAKYFYDLFGGSGTATLSIAPFKYNYLSDIEPNIYNFYNVVREECSSLKRVLKNTIKLIDNPPRDEIYSRGKEELEKRFKNQIIKRVKEFKSRLDSEVNDNYPEIIPEAKSQQCWWPEYKLVVIDNIESQLKAFTKLIDLLPDKETKNYFLYSERELGSWYIDDNKYALDTLYDEYENFKNPNPSLIYALGLYRDYETKDDKYFELYSNNYKELSKAYGSPEEVSDYYRTYLSNLKDDKDSSSNQKLLYPELDVERAAEFYFLHCFAFSGTPSITGVNIDALIELKVSLDIESYRKQDPYIMQCATPDELVIKEKLISRGIRGLEVVSERLQKVELDLMDAHSILNKTLQDIGSSNTNKKNFTLNHLRSLEVLDREECIFYLDPPYPGTVEYRGNTATEEKNEGKEEKLDSFNYNMFYKDIKGLKRAKWVVSCEAGISRRSKTANNETKNSSNASKVSDFLEKFRSYAKYAIFPITHEAQNNGANKTNSQRAKDFLEEKIRENIKVEVMITNFDFNCPDKQFLRNRNAQDTTSYDFSKTRNLGYCKVEYEDFWQIIQPLLSEK